MVNYVCVKKTKTSNSVAKTGIADVGGKHPNNTSSKMECNGEQGKACRQILEAQLGRKAGKGQRAPQENQSKCREQNQLRDCRRSLRSAEYRSYLSLSGRVSKVT